MVREARSQTRTSPPAWPTASRAPSSEKARETGRPASAVSSRNTACPSVVERRPYLEVLVGHVLLDVRESHLSGRPVPLLGDDDLDDALVLARLVAVGPVQQEHRVRVLLQATAFP